MPFTLVTAPASEPITESEAFTHLRLSQPSPLSSHADYEYVQGLIKVTRQWIENETWRAFIAQTWNLVLDGFTDSLYYRDGAIWIPRAPLQSVTSITYLDSDGNTQTWDASNYRVDTDSTPGRITPAFGATWPGTRGVTGDVTIKFVAGHGSGSPITYAGEIDGLFHAMKLLMEHLYGMRSPVITGTIVAEVPMSVKSLVAPYVVRF